MKKTLVLSILGLAAAAVSSHAQGSIAFDTYTAENSVGIITTYGSGPNVGTGIGSTFTGELLWSSTLINDSATTGPVTAGSLITAGWTVGDTYTFATPNGIIAPGYITAPQNLNITAAVGTSLYFEVVAFTGASYATAGGYAGHSATFTGTLVTGITSPSGNQLNNLTPFSVYSVTAVPEPTTLALAGLGGLASLVAIRRKKA
jgi:hypothetical protein